MVGHTADTVGLAVKILYYAIDVGIQFTVVLNGDGLLAAIGAEDNVVVGCSVTHTIDNVEWGWLLFCGVPSARWFWGGALYPALRCACTGLPGFRAFGTSSLRCSLILYYLHLYEGRCGHEEVAVRVSVMCCAELVCGTPIARAVYGAGSSCTTCICGEGRCKHEKATVRVSAMCYAELVRGTLRVRGIMVQYRRVLCRVGLWSNERLCLRHDGKNVAATKLHLAC